MTYYFKYGHLGNAFEINTPTWDDSLVTTWGYGVVEGDISTNVIGGIDLFRRITGARKDSIVIYNPDEQAWDYL